MPSLREMQEGFARALLCGVAALDTPGIRADGLSPAQRLGFYRTNVVGNYLDAVRATYRAVERLIGPGCFAYYAERFIGLTPSRSGDLNRYGSEFAEFLAGQPIARDLPYLPDVARLEWLLDEVFYEADHPSLDPRRLSQVPAERYDALRFVLHPACRLLHSDYPVRRIWEVSRPEYAGEAGVNLDEERGDLLLIKREGFDPVVESIRPAEFAMLASFRHSASLALALRAALSEQDAFDAAAVLRRRVADGTLVDFGFAD